MIDDVPIIKELEKPASCNAVTSSFVELMKKQMFNTGDMLKIHTFPVLPHAKAAILAWEFLDIKEKCAVGLWGHSKVGHQSTGKLGVCFDE